MVNLDEYPELEGKVPPLVKQYLNILGTYEWPNEQDNPIILDWAQELVKAGYEDFKTYEHDAQPWCSLGMSIVARRAGYPLPTKPLWSQAWKRWGFKVEEDQCGELGDVCVFVRDDPERKLPRGNLGHVGVVIRAEPDLIHLIGANHASPTGGEVSIIKKSRANLVAMRSPPPRIFP
jgi:hypothetical protein